ncbi:hypothetical protein Pdca_16050 [Pseudonocardia autotrophica]|nr:hypothetical protein Pdca_16050 [Pseudonocardia autotrophica]
MSIVTWAVMGGTGSGRARRTCTSSCAAMRPEASGGKTGGTADMLLDLAPAGGGAGEGPARTGFGGLR